MADLALTSCAEGRFIEGTPGQSLMTHVADVSRVLEACFGNRVGRVLLYSSNLTPAFFDLSSREAGAVLQKFRNYGVRVAVLCAPELQASHRFAELMLEENRGTHARFFEEADREDAIRWLCAT